MPVILSEAGRFASELDCAVERPLRRAHFRRGRAVFRVSV